MVYAKGMDVTTDYVQAYMWFSLAAEQGYEEAKRNKGVAKERMTATEISRAEKLAKDWREKPLQSPSKATIETRLRELKNLVDEGLITLDEAVKKRKEILKEM